MAWRDVSKTEFGSQSYVLIIYLSAMLRKIKFYALIAIAAAMAACSGSNPAPEIICTTALEPADKPKNIFLFIGDGMAFEHISVAEALLHTPMSFSQFPVKGKATTYSANSQITCSAAAATAISTGVKTNNGRVAMDPASKPLRSITYDFRDAGYKVGIATTVEIDHATPAAFYAKDKSRDNYYSIATQLAPSGFDFFAGFGFHEPRDVVEKITRAGYAIVYAKEELSRVEPSKKMLISNNDVWTLAEITSIGIERLDSQKGFFFMVEGGRIDLFAHDNNGEGVVQEMAGFSQAVKAALSFYEQHPDETIIIVTADHGTGGIGLNSDGEFTWKSGDHTGDPVPVFAIGVGSELFAGDMDNTDIYKKISKFLVCP